MADPRVRQLKIKTGVVKRLAKEKISYEKEADQQKNRIEKFKDEGKDEHVIRKEEEVLQECLMIIPDSQRRLKKAFEELNEFLRAEEDLKETEEFTTAMAVIEEAKAQLA
ncbi:tubulin-specific chaperone A-like [Lutzomyia longipalpis]|uniref:Tubulin-specific chaperone A n=1 Tax=Lutzomyia longipalpis TaxID=7200 RepID=A0A1B0CGB0_LUTLO|nr:tubulin-specific chaperone A-like [Lutzomyia longipalpis]